MYWTTDNSYYLLTTDNWNIPSFVPDGAIVLYANDDHSAVKISATKLISKWGKAGLYEHKPTQAPYDSSLLKFYTIHPYQVSQHTSSSHKWICHECNDTLYESHKWANFGTRYRCSICGMISQNIVQ